VSYILDALKKSEQERPRGSVPDLQTVQNVPATPKRRSWWPLLILTALLLNSLILVFWWHPWQEKPQQVARQQPKTDRANIPKPETPPRKTSAAPYAPATQAPLEKKEDGIPCIKPTMPATDQTRQPALQPSQNSQEGSAPQNKLMTETEEPAAQQELKQDSAAKQHSVPQDHAVPANVQLEEKTAPPADKQAAERTETAPTPSHFPASQIPATLKPIPQTPQHRMPETPPAQPRPALLQTIKGRVVSRGELPDSVQRSLPEITISALFYSPTPESRLASINGHIMREGQQVGNGVRIEEITKDGIIFSQGVYLFKIKVF